MSNKKIALVTGANRGIGFAVAKTLLKKGITVIITGRNIDTLKNATEQLSAYGHAVQYRLDVTDNNSVKNCFDFTEKKFGRLDILINNAGINYDTWQNVENADLDEARRTMETNLMSPWLMIQQFLPLLKKSNSANIVNVSSGSGSLASQRGNTPGYSLSKLALNGLTLQFAHHLRHENIRVNAVCPGWVRTEMGGSGAPRSPEEGADTIVWAALLGDEGPTGQFLRDRKQVDW